MVGLHGSNRDWSHEWIGSLDDGSSDWNGFDNDWSGWNEDTSWNSQDWWGTEQPSSNMASSSQTNAPQEATNCEPSQHVAAATVEVQDQNAPRSSIRSAKPGILPNRACLLIGVLSAGVPAPPKNMPEVDPVG